MDGEDVRFVDALRVDALVRLDVRKRGEPVAVKRGALEIERRRKPPPSRARDRPSPAWLEPVRNAFASADQAADTRQARSRRVQGAEQRLI